MDFAYSVEYSQTWSGGIQYELFPATMVEVSYMGTWTLGADNATVHNVPEPGPRPDPDAAADSAVEPHQLDPVRRQVDLPRRDVQGGAAAGQQLRLQRQLHAVGLQGRCVEPGADGGRDELPAERAEHLRRDRRVGALELQPHAPVHRQRRLPAAVLQREPAASPRRCSADGARTGSSRRSRARRSR